MWNFEKNYFFKNQYTPVSSVVQHPVEPPTCSSLRGYWLYYFQIILWSCGGSRENFKVHKTAYQKYLPPTVVIVQNEGGEKTYFIHWRFVVKCRKFPGTGWVLEKMELFKSSWKVSWCGLLFIVFFIHPIYYYSSFSLILLLLWMMSKTGEINFHVRVALV